MGNNFTETSTIQFEWMKKAHKHNTLLYGSAIVKRIAIVVAIFITISARLRTILSW